MGSGRLRDLSGTLSLPEILYEAIPGGRSDPPSHGAAGSRGSGARPERGLLACGRPVAPLSERVVCGIADVLLDVLESDLCSAAGDVEAVAGNDDALEESTIERHLPVGGEEDAGYAAASQSGYGDVACSCDDDDVGCVVSPTFGCVTVGEYLQVVCQGSAWRVSS